MSEALKSTDYKSNLKPIWCAGCGDFGVLASLYKAFEELQLQPENTAVCSGIGCSSRLPGYINAYTFNGIHGRVLPFATGVKMSSPESTVIAVGGDGDGFSIGAGHIGHAARKNIDITYIVMDNNIYGLTKGQASPTTPLGVKTKTTYYGNMGMTFNPVRMLIAYKASFVARTFAGNPKHVQEMIVKAIQHPGFSFVEILSPCVTFRGKDQFKIIRDKSTYLDGVHNAENELAAFDIANDEEHFAMGVIYKKLRPTYAEIVKEHVTKKAKATVNGTPKIDHLLEQFQP
ncbi:MAG: 2-oxoacid:ferredoxin oxidoreductase subunit beta [Candidatus Marinimicrobia bacterium]|nr:2-oxoacid:ferredoxin oxidoreductase subunit beta [Candidatus Neomarinimicrobiota bacterium]